VECHEIVPPAAMTDGRPGIALRHRAAPVRSAARGVVLAIPIALALWVLLILAL
jgi:hypothetical protein